MTGSDRKTALLSELAAVADGTLVGNGDVEISRLAPVHAASAGDITFVVSSKYLPLLEKTDASAVIIQAGIDYQGALPRIETGNPYLAVAKIQTFMAVEDRECKGISSGASIADTARIGADVTISPGCYVGENVQVGRGSYLFPGVVLYDDVIVGEDCQLHAGAVVREQCRLGDRVVLQPNCVIGSDGFGYAPDGEQYFKIPQVGIVVLEDDVEIGASTTVDRAAMGQTVLGKGCKIDNQVQVGHNAEVGDNTVMVAQTGIAGSAIIGKHCTFGGQSACVGHIRVGDNVTVVGRGVASGNVADNKMIASFPMMEHKEWLKSMSGFSKLPDVRKEVNQLKKKIEELESRMKES